MDRVDDPAEEQEQEGLKGAFTLERDAPAIYPHVPRSTTERKAAAEAAATEHELRLGAYPALYSGEREEQRLARADAFERCWKALAGSIEETLEGADAGVFRGLLDLARSSHVPPGAASAAAAGPEFAAGCQRLPTGLVLAGGVNSADHCRTFPHLAAFLRQHGCYVALLQPASLGRAAGDATGEVLRQWSGLGASKAEHVDALAAWYADETGADLAAAPEPQQPEPQADEEAAGGGAAGRSRAGRELRARPAAAAVAGPSDAQLANRQRPLVVVVEGTECVDVQALRDLIQLSSEARHCVPLTLVLGLTTTAGALGGLLPSQVIDRCLELHNFRLAPAMERLDTLIGQVLLGGSGRWPGLQFSSAIAGRVVDSFLNHYYSSGCILEGLKVAAEEHFSTQPASFLAAAALDGRRGLDAALDGLDAGARRELAKQLGVSRGTSAELAAAVEGAQEGWSRWAVGVHWLVLAGEASGRRSADFKPWKLWEGVLSSSFASTQLKPLLDQVLPALRKLSDEGARQLAAALRERAGAVWGGADAVAAQLQELDAALEEAEKAQQADQQQQQQQREQQQGAAKKQRRPQRGAAAQEDLQEGAEAEADAAAGGGKRAAKPKRDVFHSSSSRKDALLANAAKAAAAKGAPSAAADVVARREREAAAPGARLAAWLSKALRELLAAPPSKDMPGAAAFLCRSHGALDCLTAEPRAALHLALTQPRLFLPRLPESAGLSADMDDAVIAYSLLDQDASCENVVAWFESFAAVHGSAAPAGDAKKGKKAAVKSAKGKGKGAAVSGAGAAAAAADKKRRRELAARFSQATAELQYVGLVKPAKRRRGDFVQRTVHQPAAGL